MGLITWIAIDWGIDLNIYTDDTFSVNIADDMSLYKPYNRFLPSPQTKNLELWDDLGVLHGDPKQEWGLQLPIIGINVDPNMMKFTLLQNRLIAGVEEFCCIQAGSRRHPLRKFEQLAGWINWMLNMNPLLKPGLRHVYDKMKGKTDSDAPIFVNKGVISYLLNWEPKDANITVYCDTSLFGLGFYFPLLGVGFQSKPLTNTPQDKIDLLFRSYNEILKSSVDILISSNFSLHILLVPGKENVVADTLSHWLNDDALHAYPTLLIDATKPLPNIPYMPLRVTLGSDKK
ncbi:hypothetical protein B0H10DRAFT_2160138 [Mycena sp. CBHHK59/15]|nr:hypothetical protein B0H10DRAFT_2160138 [Mycena sp. CBHHK59/15]